MNNKVLVAFIGGLAVASGIMYVAMRRPQPAPAPVVQAAAPAPAPVAAADADIKPPAAASAPEERRLSDAVKPTPTRTRAAAARPLPPPVSGAPSAAVEAPQPAPPSAPQPVEVARAEPAPAPAPAASPLAPVLPPPPPPKPNSVTVIAGTILNVRLGESLSSQKNHAGDTFSATLDQPLVVDGFVIAERGARAQGRIVEATQAGRVKGLAQLGIELTQLTTADGQKVRLNTAAFQKQADSTKKKDAAKIGIGAALGAAIGAMAGGGKGAGIGAGAGGAAGAGDVLLTRGSEVEFPVETRVSFRLSEPVTITEKLR